MAKIEGLATATALARPVAVAAERSIEVAPPLAALFPQRELRRGSSVAVAPSAGATSLAMALLSAASQAGSWCAVVGMPSLGLVAAGQLGVCLERLALVPEPGDRWPVVVAALLDGVDVLVLRPPAPARPAEARRLAARARERGAVLVTLGPGAGWDGADVRLAVARTWWEGLAQGHGHLRSRVVEVVTTGRRAAAQPRRHRVALPGLDGLAAPGPAPVAAPTLAPVPAAVG